jgi:uncharacterized protein YndB with AHSA1/START domain/DNA-binding transcriptional ArsR family regulator
VFKVCSALADPARWRLVELLAERPRSVGELAELTSLRQPQATKHLQTLVRAGLVSMRPLGRRRICALEAEPLIALADRLRDLSARAAAQTGQRDAIERYRAALQAETTAADRDRWADGRTFAVERVLPAPPEIVWRAWTEPEGLAAWWAPPSLTLVEAGIDPRPGGRVVLVYRDPYGEYRSIGEVHAAERPGRLTFELSVLADDGTVSFTGHYDVTFRAVDGGTHLHLDLALAGTTVDSAEFVAGIETGWNQVLDQLAAAVGPHL